jgi:Protein of unknown function (DUF3224)
MKKRSRAGVGVILASCLPLGLAVYAQAQTSAPGPVPNAVQKGKTMVVHASGPFDVKLTPQPSDDKAEGSTLGRLSIDKQYHGDLDATSTGQMLTAMTDVKGSAGYVAIERWLPERCMAAPAALCYSTVAP